MSIAALGSVTSEENFAAAAVSGSTLQREKVQSYTTRRKPGERTDPDVTLRERLQGEPCYDAKIVASSLSEQECQG